MKKTQKERLDVLFKLIKENPDLPILPMVDSEIVADDCCARWTGSWGSSEIKDYIIGAERVHFKDEDDLENVLNDCTDGVDYWEVPEDVVEREYNNLPWVRAIVVNIDLPEV